MMALDPMYRGCDWVGTFTADPTDGQTNADVTTYLTGASVEAEVVNEADQEMIGATAVVLDAGARTILVSVTDVKTAAAPIGNFRWKIVVVTSGGDRFPLPVEDRQRVRDFGSP
jgi:hypothetical protein